MQFTRTRSALALLLMWLGLAVWWATEGAWKAPDRAAPAVLLWHLLFVPGIPYLFWLSRHHRDPEEDINQDKKEPPSVLDGLWFCLLTISSYSCIGAFWFSPWLIYYLAGCDAGPSAYWGFLTGSAGAILIILRALNRP